MNTLLYYSKEYSVNLEDTAVSLYFEETPNEDRPSGHVVPDLHDHCYAELFLCLEGQTCIQTENGVIRLTDRSIAVIPPLYRHYLIPTSDGCVGYVFGFSAKWKKSAGTPSDLYKALNDTFLSSPEPVTVTNVGLCKELYALLNESPRKQFFGLHLVDALVTLFELCRANSPSGEAGSVSSIRHSVLTTLNSIICNEYRDNIRVSDIATRLYISERQVNRITRKRYGMSVHRLILEKRISVAERLLRETSLPVEKIWEQVGFRSKACFFRAFSDMRGMTPMTYRRQQTQKTPSDVPLTPKIGTQSLKAEKKVHK